MVEVTGGRMMMTSKDRTRGKIVNRIRGKRRRRWATHATQIPDGQRPAYVFVEPPDEPAIRLRGGVYFDALADAGFRVQRIKGSAVSGSSAAIEIFKPWTFIFMPVVYDDFAPFQQAMESLTCSIVMDCHFPILDMSRVLTPDAETYANVAASRPRMLANLALADAVAVSRPSWAADLAEVNPNVFLVQDLDLPAVVYDQDGGLDADVAEAVGVAVSEFAVRMAEVFTESAQRKQRRWAG